MLDVNGAPAPPAAGAKTHKHKKSRLVAGVGVDPAASEEVVNALRAAHLETMAAKDALIAALQGQIASAAEDKRLIATQAALIESLQKQQRVGGADDDGADTPPVAAFEPA